ncbi:MAG: DUF4124 domain-containing protein [Candidatus Competibacterales bacterium]
MLSGSEARPKALAALWRTGLVLVLLTPAVGSASKGNADVAQWLQQWLERCGRPPTRAVTEVEGRGGIYRWRDAEGNLHFGDRPPPGGAEDQRQRYGSRQQFFQLDLQAPDGELPPLLLDRLRAEVNAIFGVLAGLVDRRHLRQVELDLKVFNGGSRFRAYGAQVGQFNPSVAGYYHILRNEAVVARQRDDEITRAVARHEATHAVIAGLFGPLPPWLNEGLAEYFEDLVLVGGQRRVEADDYWLGLLRSNARRLPSLRVYMELPPQRWYGNPAFNYAMGWSLVYFLFDHPQRRALLGQTLQLVAEARCQVLDLPSYLDDRYPGGLEAMERHWRGWLDIDPDPHYY